MFNMEQHVFSYNLGLIALMNGIIALSFTLVSGVGALLWFLPLYSPDLNPIEPVVVCPNTIPTT